MERRLFTILWNPTLTPSLSLEDMSFLCTSFYHIKNCKRFVIYLNANVFNISCHKSSLPKTAKQFLFSTGNGTPTYFKVCVLDKEALEYCFHIIDKYLLFLKFRSYHLPLKLRHYLLYLKLRHQNCN